MFVCCLHVQRSHKEEQEAERERTKEEQEAERERTKEEIATAIAQERQRAKVGTAMPTLLKLVITVAINSSPLHNCVKLLLLRLFYVPASSFIYFPLSSLPTLFLLIFSLLHVSFSSPSPSTSYPSLSLSIPFLLLPRSCYQRLCRRSGKGQKLQWRELLRMLGNMCRRKCRM